MKSIKRNSLKMWKRNKRNTTI